MKFPPSKIDHLSICVRLSDKMCGLVFAYHDENLDVDRIFDSSGRPLNQVRSERRISVGLLFAHLQGIVDISAQKWFEVVHARY